MIIEILKCFGYGTACILLLMIFAFLIDFIASSEFMETFGAIIGMILVVLFIGFCIRGGMGVYD